MTPDVTGMSRSFLSPRVFRCVFAGACYLEKWFSKSLKVLDFATKDLKNNITESDIEIACECHTETVRFALGEISFKSKLNSLPPLCALYIRGTRRENLAKYLKDHFLLSELMTDIFV